MVSQSTIAVFQVFTIHCIKSPSQAVETHEGGRLGFWSPNCYHHVLSYILEDIQVSDINNPDVSLNGLQVN